MTALTLAKPDDIDRIVPLIAAFHAEMNIDQSDAKRRAAVQPLLDGSPHGAIYIAGPVRAPIGYAAISFGWSLEFGGLDGILDEIYIRPGVRGRGIGSDLPCPRRWQVQVFARCISKCHAVTKNRAPFTRGCIFQRVRDTS